MADNPTPTGDDEEATPDPLVILDMMQDYVENLRGMIAMFVAEGFTDDQARALTVKVMTSS